ncbi:hypothetical protein HMPREF1092_03247 [Clostridium thermobutyricum]|uniref:Uncharacterized protein n=1 Tax=Clostridium thermobutyricum TaxID=29372 RepID=N9XUU0_9CLOT|nr:hypothetical protein [Clostridium thermobutyricum]ENY99361.1 hypothetical protein HMPREF1092_03247 [Clostridium thermobutyricum]
MSKKSLIISFSKSLIISLSIVIICLVVVNVFDSYCSNQNAILIKQETIEQENGTSYSVSSNFITTPYNFFETDIFQVTDSKILLEKISPIGVSEEVINLNNSIEFGVLINLYENLNQVNKEISINNNVSKNTLYNLEEIYNNNINDLGNSLNLKKLFNNLNSLIIDLKNNKTDKINEKVSEMKISLNKFIEYYNSQA